MNDHKLSSKIDYYCKNNTDTLDTLDIENILNSCKQDIINNSKKKCKVDKNNIKKLIKKNLLVIVKERIKSFVSKKFNKDKNNTKIYSSLILENLSNHNKKYLKDIINDCIKSLKQGYRIDHGLCLQCNTFTEKWNINCIGDECIDNYNYLCKSCSNLCICIDCKRAFHKSCLINNGNCDICDKIYCDNCNEIVSTEYVENYNDINIHHLHITTQDCFYCNNNCSKELMDIRECTICEKWICNDCSCYVGECKTCDKCICDKCDRLEYYTNYNTFYYCDKICCPADIFEKITDYNEYIAGNIKCKSCKSYFSIDKMYIRDDSYCDECCPDFIKTALLEVQNRKIELKSELKNYGLILRNDSKLCESYIAYGGDLNAVVQRMCEMKYLFDYCNIRDHISKIKKSNKESIFSPFQEAEYNILKKNNYPTFWPWLATELTNKNSYNQ
jgi:hypothetical protein